jgi:hypothetical protein
MDLRDRDGGTWTLLTCHGRVLVEIACNSRARVRDIAAAAGLAERTVQAIIADLEAAGYRSRSRAGRRAVYAVHPGRPFRHPAQAGLRVGPVLELLASPGGRAGDAAGSSGLSDNRTMIGVKEPREAVLAPLAVPMSLEPLDFPEFSQTEGSSAGTEGYSGSTGLLNPGVHLKTQGLSRPRRDQHLPGILRVADYSHSLGTRGCPRSVKQEIPPVLGPQSRFPSPDVAVTE